ncbi:MAG: primosomal protein N' [Alphaproteobacteria bacterium]|nr:primosomal protein N' [Alphaproteobacteria bacterium]
MSEKYQLKKRVSVVVPLPLAKKYDYSVPQDQNIPQPGTFVRVPFSGQKVIGIVWDEENTESENCKNICPESKLKDIETIYDFPPLSKQNRDLITWTSNYTYNPIGSVAKMAFSVEDVFLKQEETYGYIRGNEDEIPKNFKWTEARQKVFINSDSNPLNMSELARKAGVSSAVVKGMVEAGVLKKQILKSVKFENPISDFKNVDLSEEQKKCADELCNDIGKGFSVTVLNGVTGSGKTEVYFEAIAKALREHKQVLIMLPEISLTGQWLRRFKERFGVMPAQWHSDLSMMVKRETWKSIINNEVQVVAGARSALFLPYNNLGLIIVDEEHDASYKQEDMVLYQARDIAVVRAKISNIPIILASATPSLETMVNVQNKKYKELILSSRFGQAQMPKINLIDMRRFPPIKYGENKNMSFISPILIDQMKETLSNNEQILLFLNRRGYAPLVLCRKCGFRFQCKNCSSWLVEHRYKNGTQLVCHHCGYHIDKPCACPECNSEDSFSACGPGVERIMEEINFLFPDARKLSISTDLNATASTMSNLMKQIYDHEVDIIVGTQILTKGHHFPDLTLVGVIDADLGLLGGDLRAGERTYQMLDQVSGRAGREKKLGQVFLQTYNPDVPVMQALQNSDKNLFYETEITDRKALSYPPFGKLASILISSPKDLLAQKFAVDIKNVFPKKVGTRLLGPSAAQMAYLRNLYRYRLLLQTKKDINLQALLHEWLDNVKVPSGVQLRVDVDPYSFG